MIITTSMQHASLSIRAALQGQCYRYIAAVSLFNYCYSIVLFHKPFTNLFYNELKALLQTSGVCVMILALWCGCPLETASMPYLQHQLSRLIMGALVSYRQPPDHLSLAVAVVCMSHV